MSSEVWNFKSDSQSTSCSLERQRVGVLPCVRGQGKYYSETTLIPVCLMHVFQLTKQSYDHVCTFKIHVYTCIDPIVSDLHVHFLQIQAFESSWSIFKSYPQFCTLHTEVSRRYPEVGACV